MNFVIEDFNKISIIRNSTTQLLQIEIFIVFNKAFGLVLSKRKYYFGSIPNGVNNLVNVSLQYGHSQVGIHGTFETVLTDRRLLTNVVITRVCGPIIVACHLKDICRNIQMNQEIVDSNSFASKKKTSVMIILLHNSYLI